MARLPEIRFNYKCSFPLSEVEILANGDGTGILVVDKLTDDEVEFESVNASDRLAIKILVEDWANHYKAMENDPHLLKA